MYLCLECGNLTSPIDPRLDDPEHEFFGRCPDCGGKSKPADTDDRVSIFITWHELRILCMWAERWASQTEEKDPTQKTLKVLYGIADRIQVQHLDKQHGLTFRSELASISEAGYKYEQNIIKEDDEHKS